MVTKLQKIWGLLRVGLFKGLHVDPRKLRERLLSIWNPKGGKDVNGIRINAHNYDDLDLRKVINQPRNERAREMIIMPTFNKEMSESYLQKATINQKFSRLNLLLGKGKQLENVKETIDTEKMTEKVATRIEANLIEHQDDKG
eukprot:snap_masked-scaffold_88-processed-gene-0.25-mRNA-1 protein AED:1.00 eAED:1.00 QI:0/-1/0/0/-1/1/1/0/142